MMGKFAIQVKIYKIKLCLFYSAIEMSVTKIWKLLSGISSIATYSKNLRSWTGLFRLELMAENSYQQRHIGDSHLIALWSSAILGPQEQS